MKEHPSEKRMTTGKLTELALLTAAALILYVVELQIPNPIPIPGVKLGLANVVTVYAIFALGSGPAAMILLARVVLGSLFAGGSTIFYSLAGGVCCFLAMALLRLVMTEKQMWACSALGAAAHNIGQLAAAALLSGTWGVFAYLPILLVSGVITGLFTGLCAQFLLFRLRKLHINGKEG